MSTPPIESPLAKLCYWLFNPHFSYMLFSGNFMPVESNGFEGRCDELSR